MTAIIHALHPTVKQNPRMTIDLTYCEKNIPHGWSLSKDAPIECFTCDRCRQLVLNDRARTATPFLPGLEVTQNV